MTTPTRPLRTRARTRSVPATLAATCLLLVGAASAATAAPPDAAAGTTGVVVEVDKVANVLHYRLQERFPDGQQLDSGTVAVRYTCDPGDTGVTAVFAFAVTSNGFLPPTFGQDVPCDGERHRVLLEVSRKTSAPFTPPARKERVDLFIGFNLGPGEAEVPEDVTVPVVIRYHGF